MFVGNNHKYSSHLAMKEVDVELGTSTVGYFEGVGIIVVSIPSQVSEIFVLYPAFYSSSDKHCTISTGALKSSAGFSRVVFDAHKQLELTSREGKNFIIDFVNPHIIQFMHNTSSSSIKKKKRPKMLINRHMSLQPASITNKSVVGTSLFSAWLHINYGHRSLAILQVMIDNRAISQVQV
jgi:hypothetical protein